MSENILIISYTEYYTLFISRTYKNRAIVFFSLVNHVLNKYTLIKDFILIYSQKLETKHERQNMKPDF